MEQASDKLRLSNSITYVQSFDLSFPHHVHGFNSFNRPLGGVKRAEALACLPPPVNEAVVLLDDVRQVFCSSQFAILRSTFSSCEVVKASG